MPFITFIYKIKNKPKTYYGKYICDYMSDDHEGLDTEIKYILLSSINKYRVKKNLPKIKIITIGILSFSNDRYIPVYSTKSEINVFDFYYENYDYDKTKIYINGKLQ